MLGFIAGVLVMAVLCRRLLATNVCLRQQLAVYERRQLRPSLQDEDRSFWILMCRLFPQWRELLLIVKPETVLRWHRNGWRAYWRWKSRARRVGRKRIPLDVRELIYRMAVENPLWGQVRIMAELLKLGYLLSPRTVRRYMRRPWRGTPSPRWRQFLKQHANDIWACDFLTVRTLTFQTLYVFFLIRHGTREIIHVRVTQHPTAVWTGQQMMNACLDREPPHYLIRDRDAIFGGEFIRRVESLKITQLRTPIRAPKANSIAERFIGTLRRECLDHLFVLNERHLQKVVDEFMDYYNQHRPHRSLEHHSPCGQRPFPTGPPLGGITAEPVLGGLHHIYRRVA